MTIYQLFQHCCDMLDSIDLPVERDHVSLVISNRMTVMFGRCKSCRPNQYSDWMHTITMAARVMEDSVPLKTKENVMLHELLHSRHPADHHGGEWAREALIVTRRLGYEITMYGDSEKLGVQTTRRERKYVCACDKCGREWRYAKMCGPVKTPSRYVHTECGGHLKRIA